MDVGVCAGKRIPAMLAGAARQRLGTRAEQPLAEPQGEALLADAGRSVKEQRAGERVATNRVVEPRAERVVAVNGKQRHVSR